MRKLAMACALGAYAAQPLVAVAGTKDFALQGYALPADKPVTIVLMRPDVKVGELQAGGLPQPNTEWTEAARTQIANALRFELQQRKLEFVIMEERVPAYAEAVATAAREKCVSERTAAGMPEGGVASGGQEIALGGYAYVPPAPIPDCSNLGVDAPIDAEALVSQYNGLHEAVVQAILAHKYGVGAGKLPTKKESFEYSLGPGTAPLAEISGANYGLFVSTVDQFASASRKAMQVMGALGCVIGACVVVRGGLHVGYVSLVDLQTGNVVWFNLLRGSEGDVREQEGARSMVAAIMANMPTRPGERTAGADASRK